jgi:RNA polymerase sigma factor (sigma-70 family)
METSLTWLGRLIKTPTSAEWRHLSEVYGPLIAKWVERAGVPTASIDDVIQEVFIVVLKNVGEFEHQHPGAFRGWLRAILANQLKKYFRQNARVTCQFDVNSICDPCSADSIAFDREHDEFIVARAMKVIEHEFEPNTWAAFRMQIVDRQRPADVANHLGISTNAVVKSKSRVLKRLREYVAFFVE